MVFTDQYIKGLQPKARPYRVREDGSDRGFGVQVTPGGVKTFFFAYESPETGKRRFMNLGRHVKGQQGLAEARKRCREARATLVRRIDPQEDKIRREAERLRQEREERLKGSLKQLFDAYVAGLERDKRRSAGEVRRCYHHDIKTVLDESMKAADVRPHHVKLVLAEALKRDRAVMANRIRAYISAAFNFGIAHDNDPRNLQAPVLFNLQMNPARDVPKPAKQECVGNRDLSFDEIRRLWILLEDPKTMDIGLRLALRLILATGGQRVEEVLGASWAEFDRDTGKWEIPAHRSKNRWRSNHTPPHVVPLGTLALGVLSEIEANAPGSVFLFPKKGSKGEERMPLASISRAVSRFCGRFGFPHFTPRDLRRTCKSRMGELGISKEVRDRLHHHALTDVSSKHYDRYDYLAEKRAAIARWDDHLRNVLADEPRKIAAFR